MSESKFLIDPATAALVCDWARTRMERDPNGDGLFGDQYKTTSLYFDTAGRDVYFRRESYGRSKYRLRRYDGQEIVFLERKLRTPALLQKRRTPVPLRDLARIGCLDPDWTGRWFDERLALRRLRPICQVSYTRMARVSTQPCGHVRLTLDTDVQAVASNCVEFSSSPEGAILPGRVVLELKYPVVCPAMFKELVGDFRLTPTRASKYRTAAGQLGLVPEVDDPAVAVEAGNATYA